MLVDAAVDEVDEDDSLFAAGASDFAAGALLLLLPELELELEPPLLPLDE